MFRQLGINFVQRGVYDVARSVDRLNLVFRAYSRSVQQAGKESVNSARKIDRVAKVTIRELTPAFKNATTGAYKFNDTIIKLKVGLGDYSQYLVSGTRQSAALGRSVNELASRYIRLDDVQQQLSNNANLSDKQRQARIGQMTKLRNEISAIIIETGKHHQAEAKGLGINKNVEKSIQALVVAMAKQKVALTDSAKFVKAYQEALDKGKDSQIALEEALKATAKGGDKFNEFLGKLRQATLASISVVQGAMGVFNILTGIFTGLFNIVKAIISPILKLATAIGKTLVNAFKSLIALPFNFLKNAFDTLKTSLQRIFDIVVGTSLSRGLQNLANSFKELGKTVFDAGTEFQLVEIRLNALIKRELSGAGYSMADSMRMAKEETKELVDWITRLSVQSIFEAEDILNMHALGMSYGFTSQMASELTESILNFATGMGLSDVEMKRIIENFGQMRQQGKITGTELRDLARGAFVPVGAVLEQMGVDLEVISGIKLPNLVVMKNNLKSLAKEGKISNAELERMTKLLDENSRGTTITATTLMKLAKSGELSEEALAYLGTTLADVEMAASDLTFEELTKELNELIRTGETSVDDFFIGFMNMVGKDFPDAMTDAASTMKTVQQNIKDFFVTMLGWRVLAPVLEIVAKRMTNSLNKLLGDDTIKLFDDFGQTLQLFTKLFFGWIDSIKMPELNLGFFDTALKVFGNLFSVFSSINTGDIEIFENALNTLHIFLRDLGFDTGTVNEIKDAFRDLFDVFTNLDELPSDEIWSRVKASLLAIFEPLWEDVLKPELILMLNGIKELIVTVWENDIKPVLNDFIQDVILPGLNTFITETIPSWWETVKENIPKIAEAFGTKLYNALDSISTWAGNEKGIISEVVELLANLGKYIGLSLGVGIEEPNEFSLDQFLYTTNEPFSAFEQSGLAQSLRDLGEAAREALEPVKTFLVEGLTPVAVFAEDNKDIVLFFDALGRNLKSAFDFEVSSGLKDIMGLISGITGADSEISGWSVARWILDADTKYGKYLIPGIGPLLMIWDLFKDIIEDMSSIDVSGGIGKITELIDGLKQFDDLTTSATPSVFEDLALSFQNLMDVLFPPDDTGFLARATENLSDFVELEEEFRNIGNATDEKGMFFELASKTYENWLNLYNDLVGNSIVPDLINDIQSILDTDIPPMEEPFNTFFSNIITLFTTKSAEIMVMVNGLISDITGGIDGINLQPAGEAMFQGLLDGMKLKLSEILLFIADAARQINEAWEKAEQITSPSKIWERFGLMMMEGLENGLDKGLSGVVGMMASGMGAVRGTAGLVRGGGGNMYNYSNSNADNRNINVNYMNSNNNFALDYDYIRAIT